MRWLHWGKKRDRIDPACALADSEQRLAEAQQMAADAQPVIRAAEVEWKRNHIGEAAAAALRRYGSRA
jgi:hypothetical protein